MHVSNVPFRDLSFEVLHGSLSFKLAELLLFLWFSVFTKILVAISGFHGNHKPTQRIWHLRLHFLETSRSAAYEKMLKTYNVILHQIGLMPGTMCWVRYGKISGLVLAYHSRSRSSDTAANTRPDIFPYRTQHSAVRIYCDTNVLVYILSTKKHIDVRIDWPNRCCSYKII